MSTATPRPSTQVWASYNIPAAYEDDDYGEATDLGLARTGYIQDAGAQPPLKRKATVLTAHLRQDVDQVNISPADRHYSARGNSSLHLERSSPWSRYTQEYEVNFGGRYFWIASHKRPTGI